MQDSIEDLVGAKGINVLKDLLSRYGDDQTILTCVTKVLSQMPKHHFLGKEYANDIIKDQAMLETLRAMAENKNLKDDALRNALDLIEKCAEVNAKAMGTKETIDAIARVQTCFQKDSSVHTSCSKAMESICRSRSAAKVFVAADKIPYIFDSMVMPACSEASLMFELKLLNRLAVTSKDNIKIIEGCDGLKKTVKVLEQYPDSAELQQTGGRLIHAVAGEFVEKIIKDLMDKNTPTSDKEYYAQLLASLSLKSKSANKILNCDGIGQIMSLLEGDEISPKITSSIMQIVQRLGDVNVEAVKKALASGGIDTIVHMAKLHKGNAQVAAACIAALDTVIMDKEQMKRLESSGGVRAVIDMLLENPDFKGSSKHGAHFIAHLISMDYPVSKIVEMGGIKACLAAIKSSPDDSNVVSNALMALSMMSETGEEPTKKVGRAGVSAAVESLRNFPTDTVICKNALRLLNSLGGYADGRKDIVDLGGVDAIVKSIYDNADDQDIASLGSSILNSVVSDSIVKETIEVLQSNMPFIAQGEEAYLKKVHSSLMSLTIFAKTRTSEIVKMGGFSTVAKTFRAFADVRKKTKDAPLNTVCIEGCFRAMQAICHQRQGVEPKIQQEIVDTKLVESIVEFIKNNPNDEVEVREAAKLLKYLSTFCDVDTLIEHGALEALIAPLRLTKSPALCTECVYTLASISKTASGVKAMVDRGCTRQLLKTMNDTNENIEFSDCHLAILDTLDRVARNPKGAAALKKQKAVKIVVENMAAHPGKPLIEKSGLRVLGALVDKSSVQEEVKELVELSKKKLTPKRLKKITKSLNTVALLCQLGDYTNVVISAGGPEAYARCLAALEKMPLSPQRNEAIEAAIMGLSRVAKHVHPKTYKAAVKAVIDVLEDYPEAALRCLESFAAHEENLDMILDNNAVVKVLNILESRGDEHDICHKIFRSITNIAKHKKGRDKIASVEGIDQVMNWLKENADDAHAEAMSSCLDFLAGMSIDQVHAKRINEHGVVDIVLDVLSSGKHSGDTVAAGLKVFENICVAMPEHCKTHLESGVPARLMKLFTSKTKNDTDFTQHAGASIAMVSYMAKFAEDPSFKPALKAMNAGDVMMSLMNTHSNHEEIQKIGKAAIVTMLSPKELLVRALADVRRIEGELSSGDINARNLVRLKAAYDDVLSAVRLGEDITKKEGASVLRSLQNTVKRVKDIEVQFPTLVQQTKNVVFVGFELIGALDNLNLGLKLTQVVPSLIQELSNCEKQQNASDALLVVKTLKQMMGDADSMNIFVDNDGMNMLMRINDMATSMRTEALQTSVNDLMQDLANHVLMNSSAMIEKGKTGAILDAIELMGAVISTGVDGVVRQIASKPRGLEILSCITNMKVGDASFDQRAKHSHIKSDIAVFVHDLVANGEEIHPDLLGSIVSELSKVSLSDLNQMETDMKDVHFDIYDKQLDTLIKMAGTLKGAQQMANDAKLVETLLKLMALDHAGIAVKASAVLAELAKHAKDPKIRDMLVGEKVVEFAIAMHDSDTLKKSSAFAANTINLINGLMETGGTDVLTQAGFKKEHMEVIEGWGAKFKKNEVIKSHLAASSESKLMKTLKKKFPNSVSDQLATFFGNLDKNIDDVYSFQMAEDEDSKKVYYINKDNTKTFKRPPELDEFITVLKKGASKIKKYKGSATSQDARLIKRSIHVLGNLVKDAELVKNIVQALNHMAEDDSNLKKLAENGGIEAIIRVLKAHPDDDELLRTLLMLIEKFCSNTVFKERIGKVGAVEVLIMTAERQAYGDMPLPFGWRRCYDHNKRRHYYYNKDLNKSVWKRPDPPKEFKSSWRQAKDKSGRTYFFNKETKKSAWHLPEDEIKKRRDINAKLDRTPHHMLAAQVLNVLVKLTFRSKQNTALANETFPGHRSLSKMLGVFTRSPRIGEIAFTLVTNWAATPSYRVPLREAVGEYVLDYVQNLHYDVSMFKAALRAIGNMSLAYENVCVLVKAGAVEKIAKYVNSAEVSDSVKETAIRVICIFAQAQARHRKSAAAREDDPNISQKIYDDKGVHTILSIVKDYVDTSPSMMKAAVEALDAIASDRTTALRMLPANLMETVVRIMTAMDYDVAVLEPCFELLHTLCRSSEAMDNFVDVGGVPVLLTLLEANDHSKYIMTYGVRILNLLSVTKNEKHRPTLANTDTIDSLVRLLEEHSEEPKYCLEIMRALSNIAAPPEDSAHMDLSSVVADKSMHAVVHVIDVNKMNATVVNGALQLVGFLSFKPENVEKIVRMGGIGMIMNAISLHPSNAMIITRCVKNLDFIAISDRDNALIVVEHEGVRLIKAIKENYSDNKEITDLCDSALLSFASVDVAPSPGVDTPDSKNVEAVPDVDWDDFD